MSGRFFLMLLSMFLVKFSFSQSVQMKAAFRNAALQKKAILFVVSNPKGDSETVAYEEGQNKSYADITKDEMIAQKEKEIKEDFHLKKPEVQEYLKANYIIVRINSAGEDFKYFEKRYPLTLFSVPDYYIFSSGGLLLNSGFYGYNYYSYSRLNLLETLNYCRAEDQKITKMLDKIKPKATKQDLLYVNKEFWKFDQSLWEELQTIIFRKSTNAQRTDSLLCQIFCSVTTKKINAIDSFYILSYKKNSKLISYEYYFSFFCHFQHKYVRLFNEAKDFASPSGRDFLAMQQLADTVYRYSPLAFPFSNRRLELRKNLNEKVALNNSDIDKLIRDVDFYLKLNADSVFNSLKGKSAITGFLKKGKYYLEVLLSYYKEGLLTDIYAIKDYLFFNTIQEIAGQTRVSLSNLEKELNERDKVLRKQIKNWVVTD